jgi:ABC-type oligopeptide transport system ATPase subunit
MPVQTPLQICRTGMFLPAAPLQRDTFVARSLYPFRGEVYCMALVELVGVSKRFHRGGATITAVDDVTLSIEAGTTLGLIGESGSGKSTLGRLSVGLIHPDAGKVVIDGNNLAELSRRSLRQLRAEMQVVFQEPYESLNPRMRVLNIVRENLEIHSPDLPSTEKLALCHSMLERVGLSPTLWTRYPAQLSGGEQQRVGIARAIITRPKFVLLDEPTSSLDLSRRAGILQLLQELQTEYNLSYLFISHDMSTIEYFADVVAVMNRGIIVEQGTNAAVTLSPSHSYTRALLAARMSLDPRDRRDRGTRHMIGDENSAS